MDSLPVNLVSAIQTGLPTLTVIPMESVPVKVVIQVISAISVQADISKNEVEDAQVM